jgi:meiotic recombination protein REC8, fungi type
MPWNTGSRAGSATGRFYSSSMGGFPTSAAGPEGSIQSSLPRRINRLTSASPLVGRGPRPSAELERLSSLDIPDDEAALLGRGSDDTVAGLGVDEFELYGPSATVDTQTAQQTQWMRDTLDRESYNFLDFLKAAIEGQDPPDGSLPGAGEVLGNKFVIFEELLPPRENTKMVAAQGLIHALSLATKNLIAVQQDEAYGDILMSIL